MVRKAFKEYGLGFIPMGVKYLPQMGDEAARRYLFVAIERAARWVFMRSQGDQSEVSSTDFLRRLKAAAPMKIEKLLTDNGGRFTDRFTSRENELSGNHAFDRERVLLGIEHSLIPPRHPHTNGMVERFNGRVSDLLNTTRFGSREQPATTIAQYAVLYNQHIPQKAPAHRTPLEAARRWQKAKPELFVKNVRKLPERNPLRTGTICPPGIASAIASRVLASPPDRSPSLVRGRIDGIQAFPEQLHGIA